MCRLAHGDHGSGGQLVSSELHSHRKHQGGVCVWGGGGVRWQSETGQMWGPFFNFQSQGGGSVQRKRNEVNGPLSVRVSVKLTDASGSIRAGDEASWTGAHVAASRVGALPSVAHARDGAALVDVCGVANTERNESGTPSETLQDTARRLCSAFSMTANETRSRFSALVFFVVTSL